MCSHRTNRYTKRVQSVLESMCRYICTYQVACKCSKQRAYRSVGRYVWKGYREQPGNRRGCIKQLKFESCTTIWCEDCIPAAITADHEKAVVRERDGETERQRDREGRAAMLCCTRASYPVTVCHAQSHVNWVHTPIHSGYITNPLFGVDTLIVCMPLVIMWALMRSTRMRCSSADSVINTPPLQWAYA